MFESHVWDLSSPCFFSHPCISSLPPAWNGGRVSVFFGSVDTLFLCLLPCCSCSVLDGHSYPSKEKSFWPALPWFLYGHSFWAWVAVVSFVREIAGLFCSKRLVTAKNQGISVIFWLLVVQGTYLGLSKGQCYLLVIRYETLALWEHGLDV